MMELYHGSNLYIEKPDFAFCKPYKDFGKGFYLSAEKDHDSVTFQLRRFQRGVIRTIPELIDELRYHKGITFQYFFGTQRALDKLTRL